MRLCQLCHEQCREHCKSAAPGLVPPHGVEAGGDAKGLSWRCGLCAQSGLLALLLASRYFGADPLVCLPAGLSTIFMTLVSLRPARLTQRLPVSSAAAPT